MHTYSMLEDLNTKTLDTHPHPHPHTSTKNISITSITNLSPLWTHWMWDLGRLSPSGMWAPFNNLYRLHVGW